MDLKPLSSFASRLMVAAVPLILAIAGEVRANSYDPLAVDPAFRPSHVDLTVHDAARDRDIPLRVYLPANTAPAPVVLFSHGLGGTREGSAFLGEHWAARGYVAVFLQHPGSDDSVWKDEPAQERMRAMNQAASLENFLLRVQDVPAVLNQLEIWNADKTNRLAGRLDLKKVGMSGHSFGAVTTEAVSGETLPVGGQTLHRPAHQGGHCVQSQRPEDRQRGEGLRLGEDSLDADDRHEGRRAHRRRGRGVAPGRVSGAPRRAEI